jgi:hypothetical protein
VSVFVNIVLQICLVCALALAAAPVSAGSGRQTLVLTVGHSPASLCRWLEANADAIEESAGAEVLATKGHFAKLSKTTKYGTQVFVVHRTGKAGKYSGTFVRSISGDLTAYQFTLEVSPAAEGSTITLTMSAETPNANGVAVNVELRKSLRGIRGFFQERLKVTE